ncbi:MULTISPECIES: hypothetical protein [unclassified Flavobacterium]|uniref:hypothetical protein n=1 Tax=unclassified Flavobacterium TaxID=196869 RepID=UPI00361341F3
MYITLDISKKIEMDFGHKATEVYGLFDQAFESAAYLKEERIVRCIVFLAEQNIEKLKKYIKAATDDPRDVLFWAEYLNHNDKHPTKIRDFDQPFDQATLQ